MLEALGQRSADKREQGMLKRASSDATPTMNIVYVTSCILPLKIPY